MNELQWRLLCTAIHYGTQRSQPVTEKDTVQKYVRILRPEPPVSGFCHLLPLLLSDSPGSKKLGIRNWTQTLTDVSVAREPQACSLINGEKLLLQDSTLKYQCVVFFSCSSAFLTKNIILCQVHLRHLPFPNFCIVQEFWTSSKFLRFPTQIQRTSRKANDVLSFCIRTHYCVVYHTVVLIKNGCKQTLTKRPEVSRKMNECSDQTLNDTSELIRFLWAYRVALITDSAQEKRAPVPLCKIKL